MRGEIGGHGADRAVSFLLCRAGRLSCALPLDAIVETMRPLPVASLPGTPSFVAGVAIIRGVGLPVVDAAALLATTESTTGRFVIVRTDDGRCVALAVETVVGVMVIAPDSLQSLPSLLAGTGTEVVSAIGEHDAKLLVVLNRARVVPEEVWSVLAQESTSA